MKKRIIIIIAVIAVLAATSVLTLTGCNKKTDTVTENNISMLTLPQQYYAQGEEFSLEGGEIRVGLTKSGSAGSGSEGYKTVALTDSEVSVKYSGTVIAGDVKTAIVSYHGFTTSYKYYVATEANAIDSVTFALDDNGVAPDSKYAVSTTRVNPNFNGLIMTIKYRSSTEKKDEVSHISEIPFSSNGVNLSGFDVTTDGQKTMTLNYRATDYNIDYEVVKDDWIEKIELVNDGLVLSYFIGEELDCGNSYFQISYNSLMTVKKDVTAADVAGFSSQAVTSSAGGFLAIEDELANETTFRYHVYDPAVSTNINKIVHYTGVSLLAYEDTMTYAEYLKAHVFRIFMKDAADNSDYIEITGDNEYFSVKLADGSAFGEAEYTEALKHGKEYSLVFTYNNAVAVAAIPLTVTVGWVDTEITGWQTEYSVVKDGTFDFGDAKYYKVLQDGTKVEFSIQTEYEKTSFNNRAFMIAVSSGSMSVLTFDTSETGAHNGVYYISVVGNVTVNGVAYDHQDTGRLSVNYVVTES